MTRAQAHVPRTRAAQPVLLRVPPDLDWNWVVGFLRPRAIAGLEHVDADGWLRTVRLGGRAHAITVRPDTRGLALHATPPADPRALRALFRRMLDTRADLPSFRTLAERDAVLAPLVRRRPGIRLVRFPDPFEGLVRGILGQQVSLAAAATTAGRIVRLLGEPVATRGGVALHAFPSAAALAAAGVAALRAAGLTGAKARALVAVARAVVERALDLDALAGTPAAEADAALRSLPGIGPWTSAYVRMRGFGDADAFPASDLGVLKALARRLGRAAVTAADAERIAQSWRPWRAYATLHLWQSLADDAGA